MWLSDLSEEPCRRLKKSNFIGARKVLNSGKDITGKESVMGTCGAT